MDRFIKITAKDKGGGTLFRIVDQEPGSVVLQLGKGASISMTGSYTSKELRDRAEKEVSAMFDRLGLGQVVDFPPEGNGLPQ